MSRERFLDFFRKELQFYIFIIFSILLPFTKEYLPHVTFAWVVSGSFSIRKLKLEPFKNLVLLIFPVIFYISYVIGLFYSDDIGDALFGLEKKLSILFIPLVILFITDKVKNNYRIILKVFVFANFVASIGCLIYAFYQSIGINELGNWYFESSHWPTVTKGFTFIQLINYRYSNFSHGFLSIFQHSTYFSTYILFSIATLVYLIRSSNKKSYLGYYGLIIYFSVFIWLLGSRAAYITFLVGFFTFFIIIILKYKKYWIGLIVLALGIFISSIAFSNKQLNKNIKEITALFDGKSLNNDSDIRLILWKSGYEILKDNIWFGLGTGDIDEALNKKYSEYNLELAEEHNYNIHNQYFDTALKLGIFGLIIFISWLMFLFVITIRKKQFLFFYFILILTINFFFEVMLTTIAGVSFFVFFYSLLYSMYNIKFE